MGSTSVAKIGKYDVVGIIGEGGMGIVYKALDPLLGRMVAIKKMTAAFTEGSDLQKRFYFEARAVASLQHPNIVVVFDMGEEAGYPYLVMEFLTGDPLARIIASKEQLSLLRKLDIVIQVCSALQYAHEHDLVHRDVKPANVIVMPDGRVKLLDFGIAHAANEGLTRTGQVLGTINYISPEQLSGAHVDARTDVFSVGVVLYQLLTYQLPFDASHTAAIINRILHDTPPALSSYIRDFPAELEEVVERALAKSPDHRYQTAEEMREDLIRLFDRMKREALGEHVKQARVHIAGGELQAAHQELEAALKLDTKHAIAKQLMYEVEQVIGKQNIRHELGKLAASAEDALREKRFDEALSLVDSALAQDKTDTQLLSLRDQICQAKARKDKIATLLSLSATAQKAGELPMARKAAEDALDLDPEDTQAKELLSVLTRQTEQQQKQRRVRELLECIHQQISAREFGSADSLVREAEQLDDTDPEIQLARMLVQTGKDQESRRQQIADLCSEILEALSAGDVTAACLKAERASRKFPNEPELIKVKAQAEHRRDELERNRNLDEQLAEAARLRDDGDLSSAWKLIQDAARRYPESPQVNSLLKVLRGEVDNARASQLRNEALSKADEEIQHGNLQSAIQAIESVSSRLPEDTELNNKLEELRGEYARLERDKKISAVEKKIVQLLKENDYSRARLILQRATAEVADDRLAALAPRIEEESAAFDSAVAEVVARARRMLADNRLDEAALFIDSQPGSYEQNPEFAEVARITSARQEGRRTEDIRLAQRREAEKSSTTVPVAYTETSSTLSATKMFQSVAASKAGSGSVGQSEPDANVAPASSSVAGKESPALSGAISEKRHLAPAPPARTDSRNKVPTVAGPRPHRHVRWIGLSLAAFVLVVVAGVGYRYWSNRPHVPEAYVEINAVPWGTVKVITSQTGKTTQLDQETPVRVALSPGIYSIVIVTPSGAEQTGSFVVRPGVSNVYRHVCEEIDVEKMVESY